MKPLRFFLQTATAVFLLGAFLAPAADPNPALPPIQPLTTLKPSSIPAKDVSQKKPLVITTIEEAAKYFAPADLDELKKKVDFKQQALLLFAWRGSGGDKMNHTVAESSPEQVFFSYQAGRTRDLRSHLYVYVVRSNVKWSVR
jgi:hypothetical protein